MIDELAVLHQVTTALESAEIPYMLTGSLALSAYAEPRMTRNLDLVGELWPADVDRFVALFAADFHFDADRVRDAAARRSMFNLIHTEAVVISMTPKGPGSPTVSVRDLLHDRRMIEA